MILLDTHTLIWTLFDSGNLSENAKKALSSGKKAFVSVASLWEIAIKQSIGKIKLDITINEIAQKCDEYHITILPITAEHLDRIKDLPDIHKDPFDRLLIAQAATENMTLITKDTIIPQYKVETIW